jgi:hypothetical protein
MLFNTRTSLQVPLLEQQLLAFLEQLSSPSFFTGVHAQSLVFCVMLTHLSIWSLQTFLSNLKSTEMREAIDNQPGQQIFIFSHVGHLE